MIEFRNVTKEYGSQRAVNRVSLSINEQGIYCLLGRNGAGKTTLMKLLSGHIPASNGSIYVNGKEVTPANMPEGVNYIESGAAQFNMRVSQLIDTAHALQDGFDREFALRMVEKFDLNPAKRYNQLSFGMKTMLTTIISLANNNKVILLDEPVLGFDAIMREQFNALLLESYGTQPRIIIVSTHLIDEIAKVTERLIIIENGGILINTHINEIDERAYTLTGHSQVILPLIENLNCIGKTTAGSLVAAHIYGERINAPEGVSVDRMSLQDFFINMVGGKNHDK